MRYIFCILINLAPYIISAQPTNNPIFFGGNGDGSAKSIFSTGINAIYRGGIGDGNAFITFAPINTEFRKGGVGDGFSYGIYEQLYTEFRKGGVGDGWNFDNYEQFYAEFRKGGIGDGWAIVFRPEGPLPVDILSFYAEKSGNSSFLNWIVTNELNVDRYEIERANDGTPFTTIGSVAATGNYNRQVYYFYDHHPLNGVNYYRLKSIDFDGSYKFSSIAVLYFDQYNHVSIYPNPATEVLHIVKSTNQPATFVLIDGSGRVVAKHTLSSTKSYIDVSKLSGGVYRYILYENNTIKLNGSILIY